MERARRKSVIPNRNDAIFKGPRLVANLTLQSFCFILSSYLFSRFIENGRRPSVLTFGFNSPEIFSALVLILAGCGKSFSLHTSLEPNAEGSVHIPNSAQNPGKNMTSGNSFIACMVELYQT